MSNKVADTVDGIAGAFERRGETGDLAKVRALRRRAATQRLQVIPQPRDPETTPARPALLSGPARGRRTAADLLTVAASLVGALALVSAWGVSPDRDGGRTAEDSTASGAGAACRTVARVSSDWTDEANTIGYGGTFADVRTESLDAKRRLDRAAERTDDPDVTEALTAGAGYFRNAADVLGTGDLVAIGTTIGRDAPDTLDSVAAACEPV